MKFPNAAGVYRITHIPTGRCYIGSSVNLRKRIDFHKYRLRVGTSEVRALQDAYNADGPQSVRYELIELCDATCTREREQHYFDVEKPEFNRTHDALRGTGVEVPPEARAQRAQAQREWVEENPDAAAQRLARSHAKHREMLADPEYKRQWVQNHRKGAKHFTRHYTHEGVTLTHTEWAERLGVDSTTLDYRIETWGLERALSTPRGAGREVLYVVEGKTYTQAQLAKELGVRHVPLANYIKRNGLEAAVAHYRAGGRGAMMRRFEYQGKLYTIRELSELSGVPYDRLHHRLNAGWPMERALQADPSREAA